MVELSMTIQVEEAEEPDELPWILILFVILVICAVLAALALFARRRRGYGDYEPEIEYYPGTEQPTEPVIPMKQQMQPASPVPYVTSYKTARPRNAIVSEPAPMNGPMFPPIEVVNCPNCYYEFDVEVVEWPMRVQCPRCGVTGTMR